MLYVYMYPNLAIGILLTMKGDRYYSTYVVTFIYDYIGGTKIPLLYI